MWFSANNNNSKSWKANEWALVTCWSGPLGASHPVSVYVPIVHPINLLIYNLMWVSVLQVLLITVWPARPILPHLDHSWSVSEGLEPSLLRTRQLGIAESLVAIENRRKLQKKCPFCVLYIIKFYYWTCKVYINMRRNGLAMHSDELLWTDFCHSLVGNQFN